MWHINNENKNTDKLQMSGIVYFTTLTPGHFSDYIQSMVEQKVSDEMESIWRKQPWLNGFTTAELSGVAEEEYDRFRQNSRA
jgi:hypothetical protein